MKKQKGFWPGIDGVSEHTEILTHLIKDAKKHSRSLIITLLDLKNVFGEVHHELIKSALRYHHVPNSFIDLFDINIKTFSIHTCKSWVTDEGVTAMRVCIQDKDAALFMDATNWATGVIIRKWKSKKITPSETAGNLAGSHLCHLSKQ